MERPMRRKDRLVGHEEAMRFLQEGDIGYLSTITEEGFPYTVPLNYVVLDDMIYFHCARTGHKIDNITRCDKVCFCVANNTKVVYKNDDFTTLYDSAIAFGQAEEVAQGAEHKKALYDLCIKYMPALVKEAEETIAKSAGHTAVYRIKILSLSGKSNKP